MKQHATTRMTSIQRLHLKANNDAINMWTAFKLFTAYHQLAALCVCLGSCMGRIEMSLPSCSVKVCRRHQQRCWRFTCIVGANRSESTVVGLTHYASWSKHYFLQRRCVEKIFATKAFQRSAATTALPPSQLN